MDRAFWSAPHRWPFDLAGHVFLARAYDQIGRARFPDTWTGQEAVTQPPRQERKIPAVLPIVAGDWPPELRREQRALSAFAGQPPQELVGGFCPGHPEEIVPAEELSDDERARRVAALVRRDTVTRLVAETAAAGILKLAHLPTDNSAAPRHCPRKWWQATFPIAWSRLSACRIDPSNPFSAGISGSAWLFVTRKSLQATLVQLRQKAEDRSAKSRAGRKKGSAFAKLDASLVRKMRRMMSTREAASVNAAALAVAEQAVARSIAAKRLLPRHLRSSVESIAHRLAKAYRAAHESD